MKRSLSGYYFRHFGGVLFVMDDFGTALAVRAPFYGYEWH